MRHWIVSVLLVLILSCLTWFGLWIVEARTSCSKAGGVLVRGMVTFECVQPMKGMV